MPRYKITLEYDGTPYAGWQRQEDVPSVQEALEKAAYHLCGEDVLVQGAGRTDAGVHATGQVAHLDLPKDYGAETVRKAMNAHLRGEKVCILLAEEVTKEFHARFSATGRAYLYRILNRRPPPVLEKHRVWWVPVPLDAPAMHDAAQRLIGTHDFSSFRASACQAKSPIKTLDKLTISQVGEEIHITAAARSFLHHQIRNFAGTLKLVGEGKWTADDITHALKAADRTAGGPTAPPDGLYLTDVLYEKSA